LSEILGGNNGIRDVRASQAFCPLSERPISVKIQKDTFLIVSLKKMNEKLLGKRNQENKI
jgi:hypothetical protein